MRDLGWSWFAPLSAYPLTDSLPWSTDPTLTVQATGNDVAAFTGGLPSGSALSGVSPTLGSSTVVIDHAQPFEISWTPQDIPDATVLVSIPIESAICFCDAPDLAGILVIDAEVLSPASGGLTLARLTVSTVENNNATIDLVGAVVQKSPVEVR